jgi:hypothetical protein
MINMSESHRQLTAICIFASSFQFKQMKLFRIVSLIFLTLLLAPQTGKSQADVKDTAMSVSMFYPTYGFGMPGGDLAERFGFTNQLGAGYMYKGVSGWSISVEGNFIFRDGVKNQGSILSGITTSDGHIIDEGGFFANVMLLERGFAFWVKAGKLFPVTGPNPNSGLLVQIGAGMLQHKIKIEDPNNSAPQLRGDYKKGYDHLCNGPAISQFIGYQYLGNSRKINFFAGMEFVQAFTQSRRSYYFNEMVRPDEKRIDLLSSVKIGWYLPLYKKARQKYYYY